MKSSSGAPSCMIFPEVEENPTPRQSSSFNRIHLGSSYFKASPGTAHISWKLVLQPHLYCLSVAHSTGHCFGGLIELLGRYVAFYGKFTLCRFVRICIWGLLTKLTLWLTMIVRWTRGTRATSFQEWNVLDQCARPVICSQAWLSRLLYLA